MRDAAHTLRTPLTIARGHAEFVLDDLEPGTQGRQDATVLLDELRRLTRISDQLLLLATAEREEALLLAPVELDRLVADVGRRFAHSTGRAVTVHAAEPITVLADEERLRHALDALVENALHATEAGGEVAIDARVRDGRAVLEVSDTGVGIGDSDRGRIFERFARGTQATDGGFGLGLAIGRELARQMDGDLVLEDSEKGARFALRLPAASTPSALVS
jgi:signal transduction histidine kinase